MCVFLLLWQQMKKKNRHAATIQNVVPNVCFLQKGGGKKKRVFDGASKIITCSELESVSIVKRQKWKVS